MNENLSAIIRNIRNRPMWLLVSLILVGVLIAISRPSPSSGVISTPSPDQLADLPSQLLASWLRMLAAYVFSIVFAFVVGTLAATSETRSRFLLPVLDILQSIPILGFFPTAIAWFVGAGHQRAGIEAAAIFLIFTSQSWNLAFAVFEGIKAIPSDTVDAMKSMGLGPLALFRRLYMPAVFPKIIDNSTLSWANGWYFLMACEIIALGPVEFRLPGLGSYLNYAIEQRLWSKMVLGLGALIALILAMDILIWKPLAAFSEQFRFESTKTQTSQSETGAFLLNRYRNSAIFAPVRALFDRSLRLWERIEAALETPTEHGYKQAVGWKWLNTASLSLLWGGLIAGSLYATLGLTQALFPPYAMSPLSVLFAVFASAIRIAVAYVVSLLWILPLVYFITNRPGLARMFKSSAQVLASIPATAFFPLITLVALKLFGLTEVAVLLLLLTGMQWYLLFNILGGATSLPNDIREASACLGVQKWLYVKRVFLPSIIPSLVTGSITAVGGGWNALIIAEYFKLDGQVHSVFGIGNILARATYEAGNEKMLALSLLVMVSFILVLNRIFWQPLFKWSETKFRLDG